MRIYMQLPPIADKAPRFYHLHVQEDLLEGWTLVKETGYQGASGRVTREHYASREDAMQALVKTRDAQLKRGYRVVFAQGESLG
jgi:predicted DNA-binding WGR domain protein